MKNFHINPEGYIEPEPKSHWYDVGSFVPFIQIIDSSQRIIVKVA